LTAIIVIVTDDKERDTDLLIAALEHVTRWNEFYRTSALQVVNFFLLAGAVVGAAYVSALNGHQNAIAGAVALAGGAAAGATYLIFRRQGSKAQLADEPLREIQNLFADRLGIDSLRIMERIPFRGRVNWQRSIIIVNVSFPVIVALSFTAALYAWLR
jgi:hypothetical protein